MSATSLSKSPSRKDRIKALLRECRDDPARFNDLFLRARRADGSYTRGRPWWRQVEIGESVVKHRDTVVYSGNAIGKDWLVGTLVPWWLWTRPDALVVVTGPSQTLLGSVTWKEIRRALQGARFEMTAHLTSGIKSSPQRVVLPDGRQALGYSTTSVERASGQHARNLLVIVEEASGVDDEVWDAIDGLKYTRLLAIGNPIRSRGRFVELIRQAERDALLDLPPCERVHAIRIPSTDSPHARLDHSPWGLADRTWLAAMERRYGRDGLWCRSHIHAIVPTEDADALIPEAWLDAAAASPRRPNDPRGGKRRIAVDLAEGVGADSTVILVRDDLGILEVYVSSTAGLAEAAAGVAQLAAKHDVAHDRISFDKLGIGKNFPHHLARHGIHHAKPYAGEAAPFRPHEFTNIRTEAAWNLRTRLDPGWAPNPREPDRLQPPFQIPPGAWWPRLREECKALTYDLVGTQTRLIRKEDLCNRLGRSPDLADALIQSFAY